MILGNGAVLLTCTAATALVQVINTTSGQYRSIITCRPLLSSYIIFFVIVTDLQFLCSIRGRKMTEFCSVVSELCILNETMTMRLKWNVQLEFDGVYVDFRWNEWMQGFELYGTKSYKAIKINFKITCIYLVANSLQLRTVWSLWPTDINRHLPRWCSDRLVLESSSLISCLWDLVFRKETHDQVDWGQMTDMASQECLTVWMFGSLSLNLLLYFIAEVSYLTWNEDRLD